MTESQHLFSTCQCFKRRTKTNKSSLCRREAIWSREQTTPQMVPENALQWCPFLPTQLKSLQSNIQSVWSKAITKCVKTIQQVGKTIFVRLHVLNMVKFDCGAHPCKSRDEIDIIKIQFSSFNFNLRHAPTHHTHTKKKTQNAPIAVNKHCLWHRFSNENYLKHVGITLFN